MGSTETQTWMWGVVGEWWRENKLMNEAAEQRTDE